MVSWSKHSHVPVLKYVGLVTINREQGKSAVGGVIADTYYDSKSLMLVWVMVLVIMSSSPYIRHHMHRCMQYNLY